MKYRVLLKTISTVLYFGIKLLAFDKNNDSSDLFL